jgi:hypothetical protein
VPNLPVDENGQRLLIQSLAWHALSRTGAFDIATGVPKVSAIPLVYIDKNPWGRHLDDPSVPRNVEEASAFAVIINRLRNGSVLLAYSDASFGEGSPRDERASASRIALLEVINLQLTGVAVIAHDQRADTELVAKYLYRVLGISGYDGIHAAAALLEGVWYFVTGDDALRRRLTRLYDDWGLTVEALTPTALLTRLDGADLEGA